MNVVLNKPWAQSEVAEHRGGLLWIRLFGPLGWKRLSGEKQMKLRGRGRDQSDQRGGAGLCPHVYLS